MWNKTSIVHVITNTHIISLFHVYGLQIDINEILRSYKTLVLFSYLQIHFVSHASRNACI
jgi:hypothetical protein